MFEPAINEKEFIVDFCVGLPAKKLKKKYVLTPRQYRYVLRKLNLERPRLDDIKEDNMNLLNEKARILRVQIDAEKNVDNPNLYRIRQLEKELDLILITLMKQ